MSREGTCSPHAIKQEVGEACQTVRPRVCVREIDGQTLSVQFEIRYRLGRPDIRALDKVIVSVRLAHAWRGHMVTRSHCHAVTRSRALCGQHVQCTLLPLHTISASIVSPLLLIFMCGVVHPSWSCVYHPHRVSSTD